MDVLNEYIGLQDKSDEPVPATQEMPTTQETPTTPDGLQQATLRGPLANVVIVLSLYTGEERCQLSRLAKRLGATVEGHYDRKKNAILICPQPTGPKYNAAIRWSEHKRWTVYFEHISYISLLSFHVRTNRGPPKMAGRMLRPQAMHAIRQISDWCCVCGDDNGL